MTAAANSGIRLSVVVASYNSAATIRRCLRSLDQQDTAEPYEVIVVDSSTDATADLVRREFPAVKLFTSESRLFPGDARNAGVAESAGAIIAFTDADCVVDSTWVKRVLDAHRSTRHPIIGGAVENGNPESRVGWASYFCEFTAWTPHAPAGEMVEIPTTCLTMKRWLFEAYGPFLEGTYCSDTAFSWKVGRHGFSPLFLPSLRVSHTNTTRLTSLLRRKVFHGKCFARVRMAERQISGLRRLAIVLLSPLLPVLLFARIVRRLGRQQANLAQFVLVSPLVFCGLGAWACGELVGYLSTAGTHATHEG